MSRKPRLLLLDAGAVFAALRFECWDALLDCYEVVVGAVVVRVEAIFYTSQDGERIEIDLPAEVARGRVREVEMSAQQVEAVRKMFTSEFRERIDDGELEAIASTRSDWSRGTKTNTRICLQSWLERLTTLAPETIPMAIAHGTPASIGGMSGTPRRLSPARPVDAQGWPDAGAGLVNVTTRPDPTLPKEAHNG
jgi:hypothetical protein